MFRAVHERSTVFGRPGCRRCHLVGSGHSGYDWRAPKALTLFLLPFAFFLAAGARAQEPALPTFRTGTTLVEFTFVALDGNGKPITDLTQDDIVLTDGKQKRDVAFFRFEGGPAQPTESALPSAPPPGFISNRIEFPIASPRSVTAVILDQLNTPPPFQADARTEVQRYLKNLPSNTTIGLFRFSETRPMEVLQPFTQDVGLVRSKVDALKPSARMELKVPGYGIGSIVGAECSPDSASIPTSSRIATPVSSTSGARAEAKATAAGDEARALYESNRFIRKDRLRQSLDSLEAMGAHLSGLPGRKSVVWITAGMPIMIKDEVWEPQIRAAAERLANEGVVLYPVDIKGGCRAMDRTKDEGAAGANDAPERVFGTMDVLADVTGGRVVKYENDPTQGVVIAANDQAGSYTVGFYADDAADDAWHALKVEVKRKNVDLRYRQGYLSVRSAQPKSWPSDAWKNLSRQPLTSTAIGLNARAVPNGGDVTVSLQIVSADLYFHDRAGLGAADLEIGIVEMKGKESTNVRVQPLIVTLNHPADSRRSEMISVPTKWPVNTATTSLRVIVRDRYTAKYGTVDVTISR